MLEQLSAYALGDFTLCLFVAALLISLLHKAAKRNMPLAEIIFRWFVLLPVGLALLYSALGHGLNPQSSILQHQAATANIAFGIIAILAFNASFGFRMATVMGVTIWMWGDALLRATHFYFSPLYAGSVFWLEICLPVVLILCLVSLRKESRRV
jgi:hypothetical protein